MQRFSNFVNGGWLVSFAIYIIVPLVVRALDSSISPGLRTAYPWEIHRDVLGGFVWVAWIAFFLTRTFTETGSYVWSTLFSAFSMLCFYVVMLLIVKVTNSGFLGLNPTWGDVFSPLLFVMLPLMFPESIGLFIALWWIESAIKRELGILFRIMEFSLAGSVALFSLGVFVERITPQGISLNFPGEMSNGFFGFAALSFSLGAILFLIMLIMGVILNSDNAD